MTGFFFARPIQKAADMLYNKINPSRASPPASHAACGIANRARNPAPSGDKPNPAAAEPHARVLRFDFLFRDRKPPTNCQIAHGSTHKMIKQVIR